MAGGCGMSLTITAVSHRRTSQSPSSWTCGRPSTRSQHCGTGPRLPGGGGPARRSSPAGFVLYVCMSAATWKPSHVNECVQSCMTLCVRLGNVLIRCGDVTGVWYQCKGVSGSGWMGGLVSLLTTVGRALPLGNTAMTTLLKASSQAL